MFDKLAIVDKNSGVNTYLYNILWRSIDLNYGKIIRDERGAVATIEFLLLSIPVFLCSLALIQFIFIAQAVVALETAAYSAARSALVHSCRPTALLRSEESVFGKIADLWSAATCEEMEGASAPWSVAARMAVLPISPSSELSSLRQSDCGYPKAAIRLLVVGPVQERLAPALHHKACYAFEPDNVRVTVDWSVTAASVTLVKTLPPVTAKVEFRAPVFLPVRGLFATGRRASDGSYYRLLTAEATVL